MLRSLSRVVAARPQAATVRPLVRAFAAATSSPVSAPAAAAKPASPIVRGANKGKVVLLYRCVSEATSAAEDGYGRRADT